MSTPQTPAIQTTPSPASNKTIDQPALRRRIPMSTPQRKLEVPALPGYYLYWFREENIPRAQQAGYEFVHRDDKITLNPLDVAGSRQVDGNTDLGSQVSIVTGVGADSRPQRAVLMKLKQEFHDEDQAQINKRNEAIIAAIFRGETVAKPGEAIPEGGDHKYLKTAVMNRPSRKVKLTSPR